jgi:hypothetical protein
MINLEFCNFLSFYIRMVDRKFMEYIEFETEDGNKFKVPIIATIKSCECKCCNYTCGCLSRNA